MKCKLAWLALTGLLAAGPLHAAPLAWKSDPAASRLDFVASFERSPVPGAFREFDARLRFDPEQPAGGSLDVTINVASADMKIPDVNRDNLAKYLTITRLKIENAIAIIRSTPPAEEL